VPILWDPQSNRDVLSRRSVEMLEHVLESQVDWFSPDRLGKHAVLKKG
jgi:hypothetical protein